MNPVLENLKLSQEDYRGYFEKGISYTQYLANVEKEAEIEPKEGHMVYVPQNLQRLKRIPKTLKLHENTLKVLNGLQKNINWLLISEHWCGDASQITPVIDAFARASNGKINLKVVYRDQNLDLIDAHLTGTGRAIPILVFLDEEFNLLKTWGPRPQEAKNLMIEIKSKNVALPDAIAMLHKWYADDKQNAIQNELVDLLS